MTDHDARHLSPVPEGSIASPTGSTRGNWVRIGALASASAVVLAGSAIAFSAAGASSSKLAFSTTADKRSGTVGSMMMIRLPDKFVAGANLGDPGVASMDAVSLVGPDDPNAISTALANEFGIGSTPSQSSDGTWSATGADGATFYASINAGLYSFSYNGPTPVPSSPASGTVSSDPASSTTPPATTSPDAPTPAVPESLITSADQLAKSIDPGLSFGPSVSTNDTGTWTVTVPVVAGSTSTDQSISFTYDPTTSALTSASGIVASFGQSTTYALESMTTAMASLPTASNPGVTYGGPGGDVVAPMENATTGGTETSPGSTSMNSGGSVAGNPGTTDGTGSVVTDQNVVTLDKVSLALEAHQTTDGTVWLVPTYSFTSSSPEWAGPWTTIAVSSADISIPPTVIPMGAR